jgi:hypothetical protein
MKNLFIVISLALFSFNVFSQGTPHAKVFSNFNYDLSSEDKTNAFKAFDLNRAYLGYGHDLGDNFNIKITFDVGKNTGGSDYTAFLKIASLNWKASEKLDLSFGMVGTQNFKFMEKSWGKRYIYKSFLDENKWASSADAGASMAYKISENLIVDVQILNGEGYKGTQVAVGDNGLMRGGFGFIYNAESISVRVARDMVPRTSFTEIYDTQSINTLALNYKSSKLSVGGEYNIRENTANIIDNTTSAVSIYCNLDLGNGVSLFGRFDQSSSENSFEEQWNIENEGELTIFGIEKQMTEGVKISANIRSYKDATLENEVDSESVKTLFLNLEYKF